VAVTLRVCWSVGYCGIVTLRGVYVSPLCCLHPLPICLEKLCCQFFKSVLLCETSSCFSHPISLSLSLLAFPSDGHKLVENQGIQAQGSRSA